MAGIYKFGFPDGTSVAKAKEEALAAIRDPDGDIDDQDEVTAGPEIVQTDAHKEAGEFLVRIVTGVEDPVVVDSRRREAEAQASTQDSVVGRLLELPPDKLAALSALLDKVEKP